MARESAAGSRRSSAKCARRQAPEASLSCSCPRSLNPPRPTNTSAASTIHFSSGRAADATGGSFLASVSPSGPPPAVTAPRPLLFLPQLAAASRRRSSPDSGFARMGKTGVFAILQRRRSRGTSERLVRRRPGGRRVTDRAPWVAKPAHHAGPLFLPQLAAAARRRSSPYSGFARMGKTGDSHPRASPSRSRAAHRRRDGGAHRARGAADARWDRKLASLGFRVLRLDADLVERALPEALAGAGGAESVSAGYRVTQPCVT